MNRRDLIAGVSCVAAYGAAEWLRPRRLILSLPNGVTLTSIVPQRVGTWTVGDGGDIVVPRTEGSLASRLYSDQLARSYRDQNGLKPEIMMLVAYGKSQSDSLQLHRPEVCYPAIGFEIIERRLIDLPMPGRMPIPIVALTARAGDRVEDILYWTRLGNVLPRTASEQRSARFAAALAGEIGDGILFRISSVRQGDASAFDALVEFITTMVEELSATARVALLGSVWSGR